MKLSALAADPRNPRRIKAEALAGLGVSIREFGDVSGIIYNRRTGHLVSGHQRVRALTERYGDLEIVNGEVVTPEGHRFPVRVVDWDRKTERAANVAANSPAIAGEFTDELGCLLDEIHLETPDLWQPLLFDKLENLFLQTNSVDEADDGPAPRMDAASELADKWQTARGQIWEIPSCTAKGRAHRLLCGDSTKPEAVAQVMGAAIGCLMNTDPPYGIDYVALKDGIPDTGMRDLRQRHGGDIAGDGLTDGAQLQAFLEEVIRAWVPHLTDDAAFYLWHPMLTQGTFFAAAAAANILIHRQIIWVKPGLVLTRSGMYHWKHELCFYGWRRGHQPRWYGDKSQTTVWECGRDTDAGQHPTQKPAELFRRPMFNHSCTGEICVEPFAGTGSQFVAGEQLGRLVYGCEIEPRYVAVTLQRLADMGLEPRLVGARGGEA